VKYKSTTLPLGKEEKLADRPDERADLEFI